MMKKQMSNKWKKRSGSLIIGETYVIVSLTYPLKSIRLAKSKEVDNTVLQECRETGSLVPCLGGCKMAQFGRIY